MTPDPDMQLENAQIRGAIHRLARNCAQILFIAGRRCRWCFSESLFMTGHCKQLLHDVHMDCRMAGVVFSPSFAAFQMKALRLDGSCERCNLVAVVRASTSDVSATTVFNNRCRCC